MDYRHYKATDFASDPVFRAWVLDHDREAAGFWEIWLKENPDRQDQLEEGRALLYVLKERELHVSEEELGDYVHNVLTRIHAEQPRKEIRSRPAFYRYLGIAASIGLLTLLGWIGYRFEREKLPGKEALAGKYQNAAGNVVHFNHTQAPVTIRLEDSSVVTLSPESELEYPEKFARDKREVHLKGEAFFEISRNPDRPFRVLTNELVTQVLGTSFTVRSFERDRNASVSVKTGRVSVYSTKGGKDIRASGKVDGVVLRPNQRVLFDKEESRLVKVIAEEPVKVTETPAAALIFDEAPVKNVFKTLENAYGIEMVFNEEVLSACQLTANLSGLPLYDQLDLICRIIHAKYEVLDGQIIIQGEGCKSN